MSECCPHADDDHILVASGGSPMNGGIRLCPSYGCKCFATWSPSGVAAGDVRIPDNFEVEAIRRRFQEERR